MKFKLLRAARGLKQEEIRMRKADLERSGMTTKIMQRLAGKVSVLIMVALLIAAVGTYGLSNSKHESTGRATASVSPSKVETAPVANTPVAKNPGGRDCQGSRCQRADRCPSRPGHPPASHSTGHRNHGAGVGGEGADARPCRKPAPPIPNCHSRSFRIRASSRPA